MPLDTTTATILHDIYGHVPSILEEGIAELRREPVESNAGELWNHRDVVMITYADQVRAGGVSPLQAQRSFLLDHGLDDLIPCIHLLPFCPYTSDDGFSVVDYLAVDPEAGTWDDIADLGKHFDLMFDLVLNHCSASHAWFQSYLAGDPEYADFFIDQNPEEDLSAVVRPRSLPLLTPFESATGTRHVWTTFSADQVDLNYANPKVMLAMLQTLVEYARRGARIIRLDAIAYLWKIPGTTCIHLPQTHAAVKLMRRVLDLCAPGTLVLTETNVPHHENISYFGEGDDEAHMVYQFSLPPLLLDAIHHQDTSVLTRWLKTLRAPSPQTTFFNFTASHDGIGVRPLEGIVPPERVASLAEIARQHGGRVSTRRNSDGSDSPYELNISYLDAVADRHSVSPADHAQRFLATQAIMLSMQGMPAIYFHSLVGTPNDQQGVESSGQNRRINRHKYDREELEDCLTDEAALQRRVFDGYRSMLKIRREQTAFHPNAAMDVLELPGDGLLGFVRTPLRGQALIVLANLSSEERTVARSRLDQTMDHTPHDILNGQAFHEEVISMPPFTVRWIV